MIIHFNNAEIELPVNDNSYRYRAINQIDSLTLYYFLPQHVEIPIGAWCEFEGETYTLTEPENFKKHSTRNFEYTLILSAPRLDKYKFKDTTSRRLKFSLTAKPREHLQMLVDNLNQRETGWTVGICVDAVEKVISYNHAFCSDALTQMADEFETEWEIVGKTINLCKVEYNKDNPLPLSYGRGNGFKTGIGRSNSNTKPVEILFVQGGERNINASTYGSSELLLPKNQPLEYEGRTYVSDSDGFSIQRADKSLTTGVEDSLDCSHIYPSRVGDVTSVIVVDAEKHFYDFNDNTIPVELNFTNYIIEGETLTVIFQSGMLAGKEFEVKYIHADRRFEIVPQEIDGRTMPDSVFNPVVTDKYAVFGMMLPDAYICNNADKTGASWDMFREAVKYLYENEEQKFTFTGELDGIWAKKDWLNIGGKIKIGGYVLFTDNQFQPDGVLIRIVGVKDYINNPHSPQIELSNEIVGSSISSDLRKIVTNEVVVDDLHKDALQFTKRRFRDTKETMSVLEDVLLDRFTNSINPVTIQTMQLIAGDESLQFQFVDRIPANNTDTPQRIVHEVTYGSDKILHSVFQGRLSGILQHMTIGIAEMKNAHTPTEYRYWTLMQFDSPPLAETDKSYYLYAKCSKSSTSGIFILSETDIGMEEVAGYYHFLVAIVNTEYEGERSVITLYGFSEVLPGRITTDRIVSTNGQTYFDLMNNEIGGKITFKNGSSGYSNITDKPDLSPYDGALNFIDNVLPRTLDRLQAQIDDTIESWFYHYDPTLSNAPALDWTTDELKETHLDDTFTNLDSGQSWRFTKNTNNVYSWILMADSAATKALVLAGQAQDTADGKRRVFVATPYPPYDIGDLWAQGTSGDIMRCKTARASGSYVANDWEKASKYTNDDALNDFINGAFDTAVSNLTDQIDGKIETWFQNDDPSEDWTTTGIRAKHVGDMWYNSSSKLLKRYTGSGWNTIEDQKAIDAYTIASTAQDTADGKRRVFVATPYPPYDIGDLWVNGQDLHRCSTARASGSYVANDWIIAVNYDNTKTTIDGGLVTSGTIQVVGSDGYIRAGMTGQGTDETPVRFWAGESFENRKDAPYKVLQDGSVVMTKATVEGIIKAISGSIGGFEVENGRIGVSESSEGLSIYSSFIKFSNSICWAGIGTNVLPATSGMPGLARFDLNCEGESYSSGVALMTNAKFPNDNLGDVYVRRAWSNIGNVFSVGGHCHWDDSYIGQAYSNTLESKIGITNQYMFTSISSSILTVRMPTETHVKRYTSKAVSFLLHITIPSGVSNIIRLTSQTSGQIYNNNGGTVSTIDMGQGDTIVFRYYNGGWYQISHRN
jgi:hypothetical protein